MTNEYSPMTTRREVPFTGDVTAWVHNEVADLKAKLALVQQAAEQSRNVASEAADVANSSRMRVDQVEAIANTTVRVQEDVRTLRDMIARTQEDIHVLRQSRDEIERRLLADQERARQDHNDSAHHFTDIERQIEGWTEQLTAAEEHNRRNLEVAAQLTMRLEMLESQHTDTVTQQSRFQTHIARIDQELARLSAAAVVLQRADDEQRERSSSALEALRRIESEIEATRAETQRYTHIQDRLELVQAERTRHNERLNEIAGELHEIDTHLNEHDEHNQLLDARISGYQHEINGLAGRLTEALDKVSAYLHSMAELEGDIRKRQIIALEKEIRDVRSKSLTFDE
jgi:chromosome segregation ATPase